MARIRSFKPEFWQSDQVHSVSIGARLLFLASWTFADDKGRGHLQPRFFKRHIFGEDDLRADDVRRMFAELEKVKLIEIYTVEGEEYYRVTGWHHQKIDKPQAAKFPPPPSIRRMVGVGEDRRGEEGKGEERKERTTTADAVRPQVDHQHEEPELDLVNDQPHEIAPYQPPPPAEEPRQTAPADSDDLAAFDNTWELYTSFGSPNSSKSNARRRWLKLSDDDRYFCYFGLMKYREWFVAERKRRPDAMAKHLETFIDARGWEGYSHLPLPD